MADVFAHAGCLLLVVALPAEGPSCVLVEARVRQSHVANLAEEALRVPVGIHRFDDSSNNKLPWKNNSNMLDG